MSKMKQTIKNVIFKYFNVEVDDDQNLLDLDGILEYWLYVFDELENEYHIPIIKVLDSLSAERFTLQYIEKALQAMPLE